VIAALLLALAAAAAPAAGPTVAGDTLRRAPVRVDADEVQYAFQKREVTFSGKHPVTLTRADATLTCKRIVAKTAETGQITSATCHGDVRFARGARVVTCDQANFDDAGDRVICEGNVVLKDAGSEAKGTRLVYDLRADDAKLENAIIVLPGAEIEERQKVLDERRKEKKK
jgi:lipopolysaccharide export system protein LptA